MLNAITSIYLPNGWTVRNEATIVTPTSVCSLILQPTKSDIFRDAEIALYYVISGISGNVTACYLDMSLWYLHSPVTLSGEKL